jgi:riboflavin biosynthesis pyrimidine reductase
MNKPYVVCHMGSTVDGRIIGEHWGDNADKYGSLYENCHNTFNSQAWMVGRVTMEKHFTERKKRAPIHASKVMKREGFIADKNATTFAIAVDAHGKLGWDENEITGDHVIEILSELVPDDYLQYLQSKKVSYIFAGKDHLDFATALTQLHDLFNIKTLMLEGGGNINGSLLNAGLIDEVSLLVLPLADGTANTPTTFEVAGYLPKKTAKQLKLLDIKRLDHDVIWLRYKVA